jgi:hypothetical protein
MSADDNSDWHVLWFVTLKVGHLKEPITVRTLHYFILSIATRMAFQSCVTQLHDQEVYYLLRRDTV